MGINSSGVQNAVLQEVKADFKDEESMRRIKRIIDNEIVLRFERMVEMR